MRTVLSLAFVFAVVLFLAGCRKSGSSVGKSRDSDEIDIYDFMDRPAKYKGKTLILLGTVDWPLSPLSTDRRTLRNHVGQAVRFQLRGPRGEAPEIFVLIPENLPVPAAKFGERVVVTFLCKSGATDVGNVARSIERP